MQNRCEHIHKLRWRGLMAYLLGVLLSASLCGAFGAAAENGTEVSAPAEGAADEAPAVFAWMTLTPATTPYHLPVMLEIVVEGPQRHEFQIDALPEQLPGLEIVAQGQEIIALDAERYRQVDRFQLDPLKPGYYALPALNVTWGDDASLELPSALFHARALSPDEEERLATMAPVAEPAQLASPPRYGWKTWALGALLLALLAGIALYFYRGREVMETVAPPLSPWEVALQRLKDLEARNLPATGHFERYYVDLSAILRYYIEDRFQIHAPEQTTQEFLEASTEKQVLGEAFQEDIARFLRESDRVKFAKHQPEAAMMTESFDIVRAYIKSTIPKPDIASNAGAEESQASSEREASS